MHMLNSSSSSAVMVLVELMCTSHKAVCLTALPQLNTGCL